uniref:CHK domain-containing protein n=1 Tax=Anopheles epiroticus TaxID=199890 RepID=A0A182PD59_9DIPT
MPSQPAIMKEQMAVGVYVDDDRDVYMIERKDTIVDIVRMQQEAGLWQTLSVDLVDCGPGSREGDNYMSIIKRVKAHCKAKSVDGRNHVFTISLIFKRQITNPNRRRLFRCDAAFENEINAYASIVPVLQRISPYDLPYPKCVTAGADDYGDRIVLEDLTTSGYAMVDRRVGLSYDHCAAVMKELAKLHAVSLAMKHAQPTEYGEVCGKIREIVYCPEAAEFYTHSLESSLRGALESLRYSNNDGDLDGPIRAMEALTGRLYRIMSGLVCNGMDEGWRVICHGDTWVNNLMFSADGQHVRLIDLQTMRCTTPVLDILHLLYTSTEHEMRQQNVTELLLQYRRSLLAALNEHFCAFGEPGPAATLLRRYAEQFSYQRLRAEYDRCLPYGLGIAMWLLPAVTFNPDQIPDLDAVTINDFKTKKHDKRIAQMVSADYHARMRDIVLEMYDQGVLQRLKSECI